MRPDTTAEGLAKLKPSFREGGTVTAGNASMLSDGAAAVVVGSARAAEQLGAKPLARIVAYATSGVAPEGHLHRPGAARCGRCWRRPSLTLKDIDLFELNEAFAAQMLACGKELGLDESEGQRPRRRDRAGPPDRGVRGAGAGDAAARPGAARR